MIERLFVSNLVLIERAELDLAPGLNVVTGETGAGKTVLTEALGLVLGARGDAAMVGPAAAEAYVEASFALPPARSRTTRSRACASSCRTTRTGLVVARRVAADGRSRALVAGRSATRAALEAAGERLVGVVSQHEARALVRPAVQRALLDAAAGDAQAERVAAMAAAWRALGLARAARERAEADAGSADALAAELGALVERVEAVDPQPGEEEALLGERARLRHADALLGAAFAAGGLLAPEDGEGAVALAGRAVRELEAVADHDPALAALAEELRDAEVRLEEAAREVRAYADGLEHDPARLDAVEARLGALRDLAMRHGSVEGALAAAAEARERLEGLAHGEGALERLRGRGGARRRRTRRRARTSSAGRGARRPAPFARAIEAHLADLGMADAQRRRRGRERAARGVRAATRCACSWRRTRATRRRRWPRRRRAASCRASRSPSASRRTTRGRRARSCSTRSTPASAASRRAPSARSCGRSRRRRRSSASRTCRRSPRWPTGTSAS